MLKLHLWIHQFQSLVRREAGVATLKTPIGNVSSGDSQTGVTDNEWLSLSAAAQFIIGGELKLKIGVKTSYNKEDLDD